VAGHGNIRISVWKPGSNMAYQVTVQSVLHVPGCHRNLLSVSQLGWIGIKVIFDGARAEMTRKGRSLAEMA
jgi:hypothetical protein